ncbi:hypothetical protein [Burkholderia territorii]|uniref:AbiTii domain-containing protein n=1 Tax=Burkholderia territorii TaxID=1503055 RepID=UPI000A49EB8D|nr:hypothetical protein [Burkholderia territorii]
MSLIRDIQAAAISEHGDVSALLRQCKLLAARLDHAEFGNWVDNELRGYPDSQPLPRYRRTSVLSYGEFVDTFTGSQATLQISVGILPEHLREAYSEARLDMAISAYQQLLIGDSKQSHARIEWPVGLAITYASRMTKTMQCVSAWKALPLGVIHIMINEVKTAILGFAIDIERAAPNAGDSPIGSTRQISREAMNQIFNLHVNGNVGNVANGGSDFRQTAHVTVAAGDWQALQQFLARIGVPDETGAQMKADLDATDRTSEQSVRAVIGKWIGRLVVASSGAAAEAVASEAGKAIAGYLGSALSWSGG